MGKIATLTGIQNTPRTLAAALGLPTPLWNSTSSIEWRRDFRGQGHRSRSRSLQRKNFGGVFNPLGVVRSRPNLVGALGHTSAVTLQKVATLGQTVRNGGGFKVFGVPPLGTKFTPHRWLFFRAMEPTHAQDNSTELSVVLFGHSNSVWEIRPLKDPPFPGFSRFCQSLAPNDVTIVTGTQACNSSLERAQKMEQNGTNTFFDFAFLGIPQPSKVGTSKKRHFGPTLKHRHIGWTQRNLTQLT